MRTFRPVVVTILLSLFPVLTFADNACIAACYNDYTPQENKCEADFLASIPKYDADFYKTHYTTYVACLGARLTLNPAAVLICMTKLGQEAVDWYLRTRIAADQYSICRNVHDSDLRSCKRNCIRADLTTRPSNSGCDNLRTAQPNSVPCSSPLILDLNGNGFQLTGYNSGVTFDISGSGHARQLAWTAAAADDSFLVYDANVNGTIDDGTELFGNNTPQSVADDQAPNGFNALESFDDPDDGGNGDGILDGRDRDYWVLQLWRDANHDGHAQSSELTPLSSAVASIELGYQPSTDADPYGNRLLYRSTFRLLNGAVRDVADVYFAVDTNVYADFYPDAAVDTAQTAAATGVTVNVLANDTDRDGDAISLAAAGAAEHGTTAIASPTSVRYTPAAGYVGPDTFTYRINDSYGLVSLGLVRVTVAGEKVAAYGNPGDIQLVGDWNGDKIKDFGVYRPSESRFYLNSAPGYAGAVVTWGFNNPEDVPIVGDWTGNGRDQIGFYRKSTGQFLLCDNNTAAFPGRIVSFGAPNGIPFITHWIGLPSRLGVYDPDTSTFTQQGGVAPIVFGVHGDIPLTGDWDGDGLADIGVFRQSEGKFFLRRKDASVSTIVYGQSGDRPLIGDWTGVGYDGVGVARANIFRLNTATKP
jgi:hypothetical protein